MKINSLGMLTPHIDNHRLNHVLSLTAEFTKDYSLMNNQEQKKNGS